MYGIGDQQQYSTIQWVVNWFVKLNGEPMAIPLGGFFNAEDQAVFSVPKPFPQEIFGKLGFGEVFWAEIPRNLKAKRSLEETKIWAKTIVERLRLRWKIAKAGSEYSKPDLDCRD